MQSVLRNAPFTKVALLACALTWAVAHVAIAQPTAVQHAQVQPLLPQGVTMGMTRQRFDQQNAPSPRSPPATTATIHDYLQEGFANAVNQDDHEMQNALKRTFPLTPATASPVPTQDTLIKHPVLWACALVLLLGLIRRLLLHRKPQQER